MPGNPLLSVKEKLSNNSKGNNGAQNGTWPESDILKASLMEHASGSHSLDNRLRKLEEDHGLVIGKTLLKKLNAHYGVPSVRKPIPREVADQAILTEMADDANKYRGTATVRHNLAMAGFNIPRFVLINLFPASLIYDGQVDFHCDGDEKLGALALQIGGVGLPIYGMKDKHADVIGHVFLDFVETYGAISQQMTMDKGSETGYIYAFSMGLKTAYAPAIDQTRYPACVALKSTNNTPIENLWHWFQDQCGKNLFLQITKGHDEGIFNPNNQIHVHLFNWIWPPIVQGELDHFTEHWNSHVIRCQRNKLMPSGVSPNELYAHPEYYGGRRFAIPVPQATIDAFCDSIRLTREAALSWVPAEFDSIASQVYELLGSPVCSAETAWDLFSKMASVMR
ncbi:hypothetical protein C8R44DRAFT_831485 [Mycena epipterygia]|nr:hypothetical protein C8R44DRAFT_831485 [Mycena epipterygia]